MSALPVKQKYIVLTIDEKVKILDVLRDFLDTGALLTTVTAVACCCNTLYVIEEALEKVIDVYTK